jgi:hypothetical protein
MPEMSPLAGAVAAGAAVAISGLVARILHNRSHHEEMDVEVELEDRGTYRPSAQPRTAYTAPRTQPVAQPGRGEMEVEVELEPRSSAGYSEAPIYPRAAQPGAGEMQVEVDLESRGGQSKQGDGQTGGPQGFGTQGGQSGQQSSGTQGYGQQQPYRDDDPDGGRGRSPNSPPL